MLATVSEIAQLIAVDIERQGHYKGQGISAAAEEGGKCCIFLNPTAFRLLADRSPGGGRNALFDFEERLASRVGDDITLWSDQTPTPEVLDTLRNLR